MRTLFASWLPRIVLPAFRGRQEALFDISKTGVDRTPDERIAYFSVSAALSMPALAQTSSFSPPGAPETPTAPITSSPALIGSAPCAATTLVRWISGSSGLSCSRLAKSPDELRNVRDV